MSLPHIRMAVCAILIQASHQRRPCHRYIHGLRGQCMFPEFLYRPLPGGTEDRTWTTETMFMDNTNIWDTQLEITVNEYNIVAKNKYKAQCHHHTQTVPCFQRQLSYHRVCMQREDGDKYRVQHRDKGRTFFLCLKFIQRNKNLVQVWSSPLRDENHNEICSEHLMQREEWPWLAPALEEWSFSPVIGGYDFTTHMYERRRQLCHLVWRPSRMESECVRGEGIIFGFPEKSCSPFRNHQEEMKLTVWASWIEDDFLYIVAAEFSKMPQYVLRFPRDLEMSETISADLYFSPVCPYHQGSRAPITRTDVKHVELQMKRGEPGICYDESDRCVKHSQEGKCTNSALHQFANYCKRSCGLCNLLPSTRPECRFPGEIRKDWFLFEMDREERVRIHGGHLAFSTLGEFICKTKHWSLNDYKLLSYYSNGCRPRYTCVHFNPDTDGTTLQFQISKSDTIDRSFQLCDFKDDPQPLAGLIRSSNYKTLIVGTATTLNSCGLRGTIKVNATLPHGQRCSGTLSDWDTEICAVRPRLQLSLHRCTQRMRYEQEFECKAYINMEEGRTFLITQDRRTNIYSCWVIYTYPETMSYKPWREAYVLTRAQCGTDADRDPSTPTDYTLHIQSQDDKVQRPCSTMTEPPAPALLTPSPKSQSKTARETEDSRKDQGHKQYLGSAAARNCVGRVTCLLGAIVCLLVGRHACRLPQSPLLLLPL